MRNMAQEALDILHKYGWHQGSIGSTDEGFCIGGALCMARPNFGYEPETVVIENVIAEQFPDRYDPERRFARFNDHAETTFSDVECVLEKASIEIDARV